MKFGITAPLGEGLRRGKATGLPPDSSLVHGMDETWLHFLNTLVIAAVTVLRQDVRRVGNVKIPLVLEKAICMENANLHPPLCLMVKANPSDCKSRIRKCKLTEWYRAGHAHKGQQKIPIIVE